MENEIEFTAFHEAGHVVVWLLCEMKFDGVTIIPDKNNNLGHIYPSLRLDDACSESSMIEKKIQILFAGNIAEVKARKRWSGTGFMGDYEAVGSLARRLYKDEDLRTEFLEKMKEKANGMISHNWALVEAIQVELINKKNLSYGEAKQIFKDENERLLGQKD